MGGAERGAARGPERMPCSSRPYSSPRLGLLSFGAARGAARCAALARAPPPAAAADGWWGSTQPSLVLPLLSQTAHSLLASSHAVSLVNNSPSVSAGASVCGRERARGHRLGRRCEGESRLAWAPVMLAVLAWAAQQSRLSSCQRQCCDVVPGRRGRWRWLRRRHRVLARGRRGATRGALEGRPGPGPRRANAPRICARAAALVRGRPARARRRRGAGHRLW